MSKGLCCICRKVEDLEDHHVQPVEIGGEGLEYNRISICYECHRILHKLEIYDAEVVESVKEYGMGLYFVVEFFRNQHTSKKDVQEHSELLVKFSNHMIDKLASGKRASQLIREGIEKAKIHGTKSGKPIGRPERTFPKNWEKYYGQWKSEEITGVEFAKLMELSRTSLYRYIKEWESM